MPGAAPGAARGALTDDVQSLQFEQSSQASCSFESLWQCVCVFVCVCLFVSPIAIESLHFVSNRQSLKFNESTAVSLQRQQHPACLACPALHRDCHTPTHTHIQTITNTHTHTHTLTCTPVHRVFVVGFCLKHFWVPVVGVSTW